MTKKQQKSIEVKQEKPFTWKYVIGVLLFLLLLGFIFSGIMSVMVESPEFSTGNVALIQVHGVITTDEGSGFGFDDVASSGSIVELIEKADTNSNIKAIVLDINSPGGSPVASDEIAEAIKRTNKTTVSWIRDMGTSGAYWIASSTDEIVAHPASITGSIGVIASHLEFDGFIQRYNISYRRLVSGDRKDMGSPFREMTEEEQVLFQKKLDAIRDLFVEEIVENREMSYYDVEKSATGEFFTGREAYDLGLIDILGGKYEVISYIEDKESIDAEITEYESEIGLFEALAGVLNKQSFEIGRGLGSSLSPEDRTGIYMR